MIKQNNRKYYKKPQVSQVKLEIKEAVLTNCKLSEFAVGTGKKTCSTNPCKYTDWGS
jgi:hypothetical protein